MVQAQPELQPQSQPPPDAEDELSPPAAGSAGDLLVVGSYCHDKLFRGDRLVGETLGGAAAFVSAVLQVLAPPAAVTCVAKVGADFGYAADVRYPPIVAPGALTTEFHAHFDDDGDNRLLRRRCSCDPIHPTDLPAGTGSAPFRFGLAVAVAGEISSQTLDQMIAACNSVVVDVQGLIRCFDEADGTVSLMPLATTPFYPLICRVTLIKASSEEAPFVVVDEVRKHCCVVVTSGKDGCTLYWDKGEVHVAAFPTVEVDPTGAGDSFLGGLVVGLLWGLTLPDAALLGNFFGSLTVAHIGVPKLDPVKFQNIRQILEGKFNSNASSRKSDLYALDFNKSDIHSELRAFLQEAAYSMRKSLAD